MSLQQFAKDNPLRIIALCILIMGAALLRLIPHPWNFTPIGGMALFGAAYFTRSYWAILPVFAAMFLSDLILNNVIYSQYFDGFVWFGYPGTYLGLLAVVVLGSLVLKNRSTKNVVLSGVGGALLFFLISNFYVWIGAAVYPKNLGGLLACYAAGIPFFWGTLLSYVLYGLLFIKGFDWLVSRWPRLQVA